MRLIADLEPNLVRRWAEGDESVVSELVEGFWDRQYIRKFGVPQIPGVRLPIRPEPDPSPELVAALDNEVLANIVGWLAGDPDPEPNAVPLVRSRNLIGLLANRKSRLNAAKALHKRTLSALKALEEEIEYLSTSSAKENA